MVATTDAHSDGALPARSARLSNFALLAHQLANLLSDIDPEDAEDGGDAPEPDVAAEPARAEASLIPTAPAALAFSKAHDAPRAPTHRFRITIAATAARSSITTTTISTTGVRLFSRRTGRSVACRSLDCDAS